MNHRATVSAVAHSSVATCGRASCAILNLISLKSPLWKKLPTPRCRVRHSTTKVRRRKGRRPENKGLRTEGRGPSKNKWRATDDEKGAGRTPRLAASPPPP